MPMMVLALLTGAIGGDPIVLCDTAGKTHEPLTIGDARAVVLIFTLHDCPIANRYTQEVNRIAEEYAKKGVRSYAVLVDPDLSPADAKKHAEDFEYRLPVLLDCQQTLVEYAKATKTPEAVVYDRTGKVVYRGRIDDRWVRLGKRKQQPDRLDLRLALDSLLAGKPVEVSQTDVIGCHIPPKKGKS